MNERRLNVRSEKKIPKFVETKLLSYETAIKGIYRKEGYRLYGYGSQKQKVQWQGNNTA